MKRAAALSFLVALLFAFVAPADAQNRRNRNQQNNSDSNSQPEKKDKNYDFSGDDIDGDLLRPDGDFLDTRRLADRTSLIKLRTDFIKEILKSAEDLE